MKRISISLFSVLFTLSCTKVIKDDDIYVKEYNGILRSYVFTALIDPVTKLPIHSSKKLTICPGYSSIITPTISSLSTIAAASLLSPLILNRKSYPSSPITPSIIVTGKQIGRAHA